MTFEKGHKGYRDNAASTPPKKADEVIISRKFNDPDLSDMGIWMLGRLSARAPHLNDRNFVGFLRNCMLSSEYLFIRTNNAVGLAQRVTESFDPIPKVQEHFVWVRDRAKHIPEALVIYDEFHRWAVSLGSNVMIIEEDTDVSLDDLKKHLGNLYERVTTICKLPLNRG